MASNPPRWIETRLDRVSRLRHRSRRIIAALTLLGLPAAYAWSSFWLTTDAPSVLWGPVTFVLFGMTIWGSILLYGYVRRRADLPGTHLDERERQLRDRAWILGYQVLSTVVVAAVVVASVEVFIVGRPILLDANLVNGLVLAVAVLLPVLPAAALAWLESDPIEDES